MVYESFNELGTVLVYPQAGAKQKPIGSITGFEEPAGMAVDAAGNLYVADFGSATISVFHQGQTVPFDILTGANVPTDVAVDTSGDVYSNDGLSNTVTVWRAGSTVPTSTLTAAFTGNSDSIAVDKTGDVFLSEENGYEIDEFPAGSSTPVPIQTNQFYSDLAVDSSQNLVTIVNSQEIRVFAPPYTGHPISKRRFTNIYFGSIALNGSDSSLWRLDCCMKGIAQLTYPGLQFVERTRPFKSSEPFRITVYPAAPI